MVWAARAQTKAHRVAVMNNSSGVAAATDGGCGVVRFSTADYAPRERLDAWREICSRTIQNMAIEPLSTGRLHIKATMRQMPGLALAAGRSSPLIFQRRREFIDHDDVVFVWGRTSSYQAGQFGRTLDMDRGQAVVLAGAEPAFLRVPRLGDYVSLRVPVHCLSPLISDLDAAYGRPIPAGRPALQLLARYLGILQETGTFAVPELRRQAVAHIHDLLALAVGATRDAAEIAKSRGVRAARLHAIKEDIANRLDQPDLSVAATAARQRVKPRYVQRLFESEGTTFTDYVLARRLAFAHRLLSDPLRAGAKISAIALDAGFGDLSYFNRTFRRCYGVTPRNCAPGQNLTTDCRGALALRVESRAWASARVQRRLMVNCGSWPCETRACCGAGGWRSQASSVRQDRQKSRAATNAATRCVRVELLTATG